MDAATLTHLTRALASGTRRRVSQALGGLVLASAIGAVFQFDVDAKKRKRKRKKKCKEGKKKCGKACCPPGTCINGACCPVDRACGTLCCQLGFICADPEVGVCVVGQATCPAGASTCGSVDPIFCNGTDQNSTVPCACFQSTAGATRCATPIDGISVADCGHCETDADCKQLFPEIIGVFCGANAIGPFCGCQPGQNLCGAPCPVT